jgi:hypothetical protein
MTNYDLDTTKQPIERAKSVSTVCGIVIPLAAVGFGVLIGVGGTHPESDWFGASVLVPIGCALIAASLLAVICSIIASVRREKAAFLTHRGRICHHDLKDIAYPFNHKLHGQFVQTGGLKNEN